MSRRESYFTQQRIDMVQTISEYCIIARCPRCHAIVKWVGVDPTDVRSAAETADDWRQEGYTVDKVSRALVRAQFSSRGCLCERETA